MWAGKAQLRNPELWIERIVNAGFDSVHVVVNDLSRWRVRSDGSVTRGLGRGKSATHWETYDRSKLLRFAELATAAGLEVHTLFWCVPTLRGIRAAARWLNSFAAKTPIVSHVLDGEEPITRSSYADFCGSVTDCARAMRTRIRGRLGVTHIGYAPLTRLRPFCEQFDFSLPQTYLTTTSGLSESSVGRLVERARDVLNARHVVGGFALYRQTRRNNIAATLGALEAHGVTEAVGWHASNLRSARIRRQLAQAREV